MNMNNYQSEIQKIRRQTSFTIALVGNPNVGKSTIFNHLTGLGAVTANYPGKTVALNIGPAEYQGLSIGIIDLPGTYSLGSVSEDQFVARQEILEGHANVVVVIVDATNLERNLYMVLQLIDLGFPVVVACNLMDLAAKHNICVNTAKLSEYLGVPVIPMTATTGEGIDKLIETCIDIAQHTMAINAKLPAYGKDIMDHINELTQIINKYMIDKPYNLSARAVAVLILEQDEEFIKILAAGQQGQYVLGKAKAILENIEKTHGEKPAIRIARERHGYEGFLADKVQQIGICQVSLSTKLWRFSLKPVTGLPILLAGLIVVFLVMYYIGGFLATGFDLLWTSYISPYIKAAVFNLFGHNTFAKTMLWGFDAGIQAALSVGIPYILTFYIMLAFLEDTGYLNSIAFLTDSLMHKIGLHGRSIIPIIAGAGCNVPAILGTRVLTTRREKIIACTLITLVPCSARTAIIMGAVAFFAGWQWALAIYLIDFLLGILIGRMMAVFLPGQSSGLVMEMFPFRMPKVATVLKKTWYRFKEFLIVAIPIIAIGSLVLGSLYETKYLWYITRPMSFIIENWLGLPSVAGICLLFGILRKELALQLLLALAIVQYGPNVQNLLHFMNKQQIFIFGLVTTLYIPCIAAISVLIKELSWKTAVLITLFTITLAVVVGGLANQALNIFHLF
ncbi:MAG: ferrous iron transport protein B [bacterium]|nr:ferrous iron transport protein B [bacterium]MDD5756726.1 ferrous iron transport protein B [bacterium]